MSTMCRLWDDKPYHSLDWEVQRTFGKKLYRLSVDGGMSCPNRDGTVGTGGCMFCSAGGSGDFAEDRRLSISEQLSLAKNRISRKLPKTKPYGFIAYFQAFTNTYAPVEYLEKIFTEAIDTDGIEALSIATRPDCLPPEVLALLERLNQKKPVWIELGLQTADDRTADFFGRGYHTSCFTEARAALKHRKIPVIAHVILGLPGEGQEEVLNTIRYLNEQEIDGVKLQLLHILKGTRLAKLYEADGVHALTFPEYEDLLFSALAALRPETVVHRITGDGPKRLLIAPLWSTDKKRVLNTLLHDMKEQGIYQGQWFLSGKG